MKPSRSTTLWRRHGRIVNCAMLVCKKGSGQMRPMMPRMWPLGGERGEDSTFCWTISSMWCRWVTCCSSCSDGRIGTIAYMPLLQYRIASSPVPTLNIICIFVMTAMNGHTFVGVRLSTRCDRLIRLNQPYLSTKSLFKHYQYYVNTSSALVFDRCLHQARWVLVETMIVLVGRRFSIDEPEYSLLTL